MEFKDFILYAFNFLQAIALAAIGFIINRIFQSIDKLEAKNDEMKEQLFDKVTKIADDMKHVEVKLAESLPRRKK